MIGTITTIATAPVTIIWESRAPPINNIENPINPINAAVLKSG